MTIGVIADINWLSAGSKLANRIAALNGTHAALVFDLWRSPCAAAAVASAGMDPTNSSDARASSTALSSLPRMLADAVR